MEFRLSDLNTLYENIDNRKKDLGFIDLCVWSIGLFISLLQWRNALFCWPSTAWGALSRGRKIRKWDIFYKIVTAVLEKVCIFHSAAKFAQSWTCQFLLTEVSDQQSFEFYKVTDDIMTHLITRPAKLQSHCRCMLLHEIFTAILTIRPEFYLTVNVQ